MISIVHRRLLGGALLALALGSPLSAQQSRTLVAVFAHPDDERIAGPLLARYARLGHRVYLVIVTDGSKGVTRHAGIPAGDSLAAVRALETKCAARELGIMPPIMLGLEDGGLASFEALGRMRAEMRRIFKELRPDAIISFGPEGGTGHPDHRLVGNVVTQVVQAGEEGVTDALYYPALPAERMSDAPKAFPTMNTVALRYLNVRVPFEKSDFDAARREYGCHKSQYTPEQVEANMRYMEHGFAGAVHLRHWNGGPARSELFEAIARAR